MLGDDSLRSLRPRHLDLTTSVGSPAASLYLIPINSEHGRPFDGLARLVQHLHDRGVPERDGLIALDGERRLLERRLVKGASSMAANC